MVKSLAEFRGKVYKSCDGVLITHYGDYIYPQNLRAGMVQSRRESKNKTPFEPNLEDLVH